MHTRSARAVSPERGRRLAQSSSQIRCITCPWHTIFREECVFLERVANTPHSLRRPTQYTLQGYQRCVECEGVLEPSGQSVNRTAPLVSGISAWERPCEGGAPAAVFRCCGVISSRCPSQIGARCLLSSSPDDPRATPTSLSQSGHLTPKSYGSPVSDL